jgi:hypothetical protein
MMHDLLDPARAAPFLAIALLVGYLLGSIPMGVLIARARGLGDLRAGSDRAISAPPTCCAPATRRPPRR